MVLTRTVMFTGCAMPVREIRITQGIGYYIESLLAAPWIDLMRMKIERNCIDG